MKIKGRFAGEMDVKRFYLYGMTIESECDKCKKVITFDGDREYITHPNIGTLEYVPFYCEDCDNEWNEEVILELLVHESVKNTDAPSS